MAESKTGKNLKMMKSDNGVEQATPNTRGVN